MAQNWLEIAGTQTILKILIGLIFFLPTYGILLSFFSKKINPIKIKECQKNNPKENSVINFSII